MSAVKAIARAFSPNAKAEGSGWRTLCPICGGHNLVLSRGNKRAVVGKCWNNECGVQSTINRQLRRLGLQNAPRAERNTKEQRNERNRERAHEIWTDAK